MTRHLALVAAALIATWNPVTGQDVRFSASTDVVPIYATALDRNGRLVTNLTRDDFIVEDNGRPRPITYFTNESQPFSVVMMLDRSGSMSDHARLIQRAGITFVRRMAADDRARIGGFGNDIEIVPGTFTSDRNVLVDILERDPPEVGPSPVWAAVDESITALQNEPGRRVVLLFSDGHNTHAYQQAQVTVQDLKQRAEQHDIMIYVIGFASTTTIRKPTGTWMPPGFQTPFPGPIPRRPPADPPSPFPQPFPPRTQTVTQVVKPDPSLRALAEYTGGGYFELTRSDNLSDLFGRVAEELHRQYYFGIAATELDGTVHTLDVKTRRPGIEVRSRKGYLAQPRSSVRPSS